MSDEAPFSVIPPDHDALLRAFGRTIWLDADEETLWKRASLRGTRPLLQTANPRERFAEIFRHRQPLYAAAADERIDTTNRSLAEVANEILCTFASK